MHFDKKKQEINAFWPFFFTFFSLCLRLFQVLSWLKQKKLQKDEILGAFAPKITSFYTTNKESRSIKFENHVIILQHFSRNVLLWFLEKNVQNNLKSVTMNEINLSVFSTFKRESQNLVFPTMQ